MIIMMKRVISCVVAGAGILCAAPTFGDTVLFNSGAVDGRMASASREGTSGNQIETADDFVLSSASSITSATFTGLIPAGASVSDVEIEFYHVFPVDSSPFDNKVPTRVNSPSDVEIPSATRDALGGSLTFATQVLAASFTAANSVLPGGIHASPNQLTGGNGPATGTEVQFSVNFSGNAINLGADHYFFRPEVQLTNGTFLWLSAERPITSGTPFTPDLQAWTRDDSLSPDWLRIGTDIEGTGKTYNMAFTLSGASVPVPVPAAVWTGLGMLLSLAAHRLWKTRRATP